MPTRQTVRGESAAPAPSYRITDPTQSERHAGCGGSIHMRARSEVLRHPPTRTKGDGSGARRVLCDRSSRACDRRGDSKDHQNRNDHEMDPLPKSMYSDHVERGIGAENRHTPSLGVHQCPDLSSMWSVC